MATESRGASHSPPTSKPLTYTASPMDRLPRRYSISLSYSFRSLCSERAVQIAALSRLSPRKSGRNIDVDAREHFDAPWSSFFTTRSVSFISNDRRQASLPSENRRRVGWSARSVSGDVSGVGVSPLFRFCRSGSRFLPMLSNDRRRSLADLCFDTEVVSVQADARSDAQIETSVRWFARFFLAAMPAGDRMTVYVCRSLLSASPNQADLSAWFSDRAGHCEAVDDAVDALAARSEYRQSQAGWTSRWRCMRQDLSIATVCNLRPIARPRLPISEANYYLAQSFVHTDDTDGLRLLSRARVQKAIRSLRAVR